MQIALCPDVVRINVLCVCVCVSVRTVSVRIGNIGECHCRRQERIEFNRKMTISIGKAMKHETPRYESV